MRIDLQTDVRDESLDDWDYVDREAMRAADRRREWREKMAALNAPARRERFRAVPNWANSVAFYLLMGVFAAVFGSILVRWLTGGH